MVNKNYGRVFQGCLFEWDYPGMSLYDIGSLIERFSDRSFIAFHKCGVGYFHMHFVLSVDAPVSCVGFASLVGCRPVDIGYCSSFESMKEYIVSHLKESRDF